MPTTFIFLALLILAVLGTILAAMRRRRSVRASEVKPVAQLDREHEKR